MKVLISKSDIQSKFSVCYKSVKASIMENVGARLSAKNGKLWFGATDGELVIEAVADCSSLEDGEVVVPIGKISDVFSNISGEMATLEISGTRLVIKSGKSTYRIPVLSAGQFMVSNEAIELKPINPAIFELADAVSFSAIRKALEEGGTKAYGVAIRKTDKGVFVFANNDHRCCFGLLSEDAIEKSMVLPMRFLDAVSVAIDKSDGEVLLGEGNNNIKASVGPFTIMCRKRSFNPPAVEKVLSRFIGEDLGCGMTFKAPRVEMLTAAKSTGMFNKQDELNSNTCRLAGVDKRLTISSLNAEDSGVESVVSTEESCDGVGLILNSKYMAEYLASVDSDAILVGYGGNKAPLIMRGKSGDIELTYTMSPINR